MSTNWNICLEPEARKFVLASGMLDPAEIEYEDIDVSLERMAIVVEHISTFAAMIGEIEAMPDESLDRLFMTLELVKKLRKLASEDEAAAMAVRDFIVSRGGELSRLGARTVEDELGLVGPDLPGWLRCIDTLAWGRPSRPRNLLQRSARRVMRLLVRLIQTLRPNGQPVVIAARLGATMRLIRFSGVGAIAPPLVAR